MTVSTPDWERFDLPVGFGTDKLRAMLVAALDCGCSDIKIQSGDFVTVYWRRYWWPYSNRVLDENEVSRIIATLTNPSAVTELGAKNEIDEAPEFFRPGTRDLVRFRLNAVASRVGGVPNGISITLRSVPDSLPDIAKQGLPDGLAEDLLPTRGVVLISGATGSGKTTLIASLLNERLKEIPGPSILTYEDPPEFSYDKVGLGRGPLVSQVHIGSHIRAWNRAGPTAMRRKGDLILMGEVRDSETAEATMEMGITGHGVYATVHADTPNETIYRIVEMFPEGVRSAASSKLLSSLRIICSQKLIVLLSGRITALRSWLVFDSAIKDDLTSGDWPYPRWAGYVRNRLRERGQDFASQCIPLIRAGEINAKMLWDICQMSREEADKFIVQVMRNDVDDKRETV